MGHGREGLPEHPIQRSGRDQRQQYSRLHVAWTFSTGPTSGHEAAPLVVGTTMYLVSPFPNQVVALDLTQPGAPIKWRYDPRPQAAAKGVACCAAWLPVYVVIYLLPRLW